MDQTSEARLKEIEEYLQDIDRQYDQRPFEQRPDSYRHIRYLLGELKKAREEIEAAYHKGYRHGMKDKETPPPGPPAAPNIKFHILNDRMILHLSDTHVQYDSPSLGIGRHYPKTPIEKFLSWAGRDVTEEMPVGEWRKVKP